MSPQNYGFSTGALAKSNYLPIIEWSVSQRVRSIELSALRLHELRPLVEDLPNLELDAFSYVSLHAPSAYEANQEDEVLELLQSALHHCHRIVVHPDVIYTSNKWRVFGENLLIENMDRRKSLGRTTSEMDAIFEQLPEAKLCLDVAHARQMDTTLGLLTSLALTFVDRIAELHISELDSSCRHRQMSWLAIQDFRSIADNLPDIPVIIESMMDKLEQDSWLNEINQAKLSLEE